MIRRAYAAFRKLPSRRDLAELCIALIAFVAIAGPFALNTGLAHWAPRDGAAMFWLALRAFFIPALGEELIFRGALVPSAGESTKPATWIVVSTAAFAAWHVIETTFLPGAASTFLRPDFLALATLLGLICALLRRRSSSIWTAVLLHWLCVVAWQGWFGGPSFGAST